MLVNIVANLIDIRVLIIAAPNPRLLYCQPCEIHSNIFTLQVPQRCKKNNVVAATNQTRRKAIHTHTHSPVPMDCRVWLLENGLVTGDQSTSHSIHRRQCCDVAIVVVVMFFFFSAH
uniref:Uncharacterized protein n=1 Tax=Ceratitis capitata TaxID=7213 RepID=W8C9D7_CERCA